MGRGSAGLFVELEELVALREADSALHAGSAVHAGSALHAASALRSKQATSGQFRRAPATKSNERAVLLVVDQRLCMFFGSAQVTKSAFAARVAALIAWRTIAAAARLGAVIVGEHRHWSLPAMGSSGEVMAMLEQLVEAGRALDGCRPGSNDPFRGALEAASEQSPEDALVMVISDLRGLSEHAISVLGRLRQRNDLLLGWVIDPIELALPDPAPLVSEGLGEGSWPGSDAALRSALTAAFEQERARVRHLSLTLAAPHRQLRTDRPLLEQLRSTPRAPGRLPVGRVG
ncbi:MAG TPA: hypothetical protein VFU02_22520 [Polyangiaceae bacterium]|nr:hypothetical protein [Polyangiaceae bacterium]